MYGGHPLGLFYCHVFPPHNPLPTSHPHFLILFNLCVCRSIYKFSHQHKIGVSMPTDVQQMKIQLLLETWYDWLAFVRRHRLGKIVPMIGDRRFGSIVQKFLHEYGEITIDHIEIVAPYEEDPSGHPRSVRNFMLNFQQNGLLHNVNLWIDTSSKDIVQPLLSHILPLINGIATVDLMESAQLVDIYDAGNSKQIYVLNMRMMAETRFLSVDYDHKNLHANVIDLYCRWLYQPARADADGKSRVLFLGRFNADSESAGRILGGIISYSEAGHNNSIYSCENDFDRNTYHKFTHIYNYCEKKGESAMDISS